MPTSAQKKSIEQFLQGAENEVRAVRAETPAAPTVSLSSGRLKESLPGKYVYLFACRTWSSELNERELLIRRSRARTAWLPANARRLPSGEVWVEVESPLGPPLDSFQLRVDDSVGWRVMSDNLRRLLEDEGGNFNFTSSGWVLNQGQPRLGRLKDVSDLVPGFHQTRPNSNQIEAVERALGSDLTFIWGPPGTGKTEVVSRIVEGSWRQGLRVLFLAPTNVAVDQAATRICELVSGDPRFARGLVQRVGEIALPSLESRFGDEIVPSKIVDRLSTEVRALIERLQVQLVEARRQRECHATAEAALDIANDLQLQKQKVDKAVGDAGITWQRLEDRVGRIDTKLSRLETKGGESFSETWRARRISKLRTEREEIRKSHEYSVISDLRVQAADIDRHLLTAQSDYHLAIAQLRGTDSAEVLERKINDYEARLRDARKDSEHVSRQVRGNCWVLGTTVARAVQSKPLMKQIDVVVIDEAGMVDLPSIWFSAGLSRKRVVVAGDFRQLPAVTHGARSRSLPPDARAHNAEWVDRTAFGSAGLLSTDGHVHSDARLVLLDTQYRMRRPICELINTIAYPDARLATGRNEQSRLSSSSLLPAPLVLVDSSARRVSMRERAGSHKVNAVHEAVIHEIVRGLQYDEVLPPRRRPQGVSTATTKPAAPQPPELFAAIAPYNDQVNSLKKSLGFRFGENYDGVVDTIHRFQGSQRPVVLFDTVAGAGRGVGYFYNGSGLLSDTTRLINVALSRAQDHLVVVADVDFLTDQLPPDSPAREMIRHLLRHASRLSVEDLIPTRNADELAGLDAQDLARPAFFPADEVPRAVEWDLDHAVRSVVIYCAFLNQSAASHWTPRLKSCLSRGVSVTVFTREHEAGSSAAKVAEGLRVAGCVVNERSRMHEKVLLVDDEILWHGSLNLLASVGPTDLMMRLPDKESCARVRRIVDHASPEGPARTPQWQNSRTPQPGDPVPGVVKGGRLYLAVPIEQKEEAKRVANARWDPEVRLWHVDASTPRDKVRRWLPNG